MVSWWASAKSEGAITTFFLISFFDSIFDFSSVFHSQSGRLPLGLPTATGQAAASDRGGRRLHFRPTAAKYWGRVGDAVSTFQSSLTPMPSSLHEIPGATVRMCMYGGLVLSNWPENTTGVQRQTFNLILLLSPSFSKPSNQPVP